MAKKLWQLLEENKEENLKNYQKSVEEGYQRYNAKVSGQNNSNQVILPVRENTQSTISVSQNIQKPSTTNKNWRTKNLPTTKKSIQEISNKVIENKKEEAKKPLQKGKYVWENLGSGVTGGLAGIAQAGFTDIANQAQKGQEESVPEAILNSLPIISDVKNIGNRAKILTDKNRNGWQKVSDYVTTSFSDALNMIPGKKEMNLGIKLASKLNPKLSEEALNANDIISKPIDEKKRELAEEGQYYDKVTQKAGQVGQVIGNMLPSIAATAITKNPNIGLAAMGVSAKGQATQEALNKGASLEQAVRIGDTKGAIEVLTEKITSGLSIFGKGVADDVIEDAINKGISNRFINYVTKKGVGIAGEIGEETISDLAGLVIDKGSIDPDATYTWQDWLDMATTTILSTGTLNALSGEYSRSAYQQNVNEMQQYLTKESLRQNINDSKLPEVDKKQMLDYLEKNEITEADFNSMKKTLGFGQENIENNEETLYNNNESEGEIYDTERNNNQYYETEKVRENQPVLSENAIPYTRNEITNELYEQNRKEVENTLKNEIKNNFGFEDETIKDIYNNISQKEDLTREDIYKAFDRHREIMSEDVTEDIKQTVNNIKKTLRTTKIDTSTLKGDIADYKDFYRRNFNRVSMGNSGIQIDALYKELVSTYPGYFDENITNPSDQLQKIVEWRDVNADELLKPTTYTLTNSDLDQTVDTILAYSEYLKSIKPKNSSQSSFNLPVQENTPGESINWNEIERPEGKFRKHYQSVVNSSQTTKEAKQVAKKLMKEDVYTPISNYKTLTKVNENIQRNGADSTYEGFKNKLSTNERVTLQDIATGERLIQIYSQRGDYAKVNDLIQNVAILGTELGQQVQALSLIKRASPEGQLAYLQKVIDRTNIKENTDIKVTDEMAEKILKSKNQEELQENLSEVALELANELPITRGDKIRSWRYLSMLGNPRTHIRNLAANVAMNIAQKTKNRVAAAGEDITSLFKDFERTKTLKLANKDQKNFAKQDAEVMQDLIDGGGKYDIKNEIQSNKRQFDSKILNRIAEFNSSALDIEDKLFLKSAYKQAMQNYMAANKLSSQEMEGKTLQKAREYASVQAQEATFHQYSAIASAINNFESRNNVTKVVTGALLPFKKTPINIAKTGLEYSPINIARAIGGTIQDITKTTNEYQEQLEKGNLSQEDYNAATSQLVTNRIDQMAKGLTGTSIAIIGYALAKAGILKAGNDGKDDEFEEKLGNQEYSVKIGDYTFSLDWLSPSSIPLFTGATIYKMMNTDEEKSEGMVGSVLTGLAKSLEPMTEMSMLQGLTSAISSYEQGSSNMLMDLGASAGQSYLGQFIPTSIGQIAKTIDPNVRDTSSTKKGIEKKIDQFKNQTISKIPGLSKILPTKTDVWGNDRIREGNTIERLVKNAILPFNIENVKDDKVSRELTKVYNDTGEASVLPTTIDKKQTINKKDYVMTSEELAKYKKQYGQITYKLLSNLTSSAEYKKLTSEQKQIAINDLYKYAKEQVKIDYAKENKLDYKPSTLSEVVNKLDTAGKANYLEYLAETKDIQKEKEKLNVLSKASYSNRTKEIIYENSIGKDDELYSVMKKSNIDITEYLKYKTQEFVSDKKDDGTLNGKSISGSKKSKVLDYINNMSDKVTYEQKLLLAGTQYKLNNAERNKIYNYVKSLKLTQKENEEIFSKLQGFTVYKNGNVEY